MKSNGFLALLGVFLRLGLTSFGGPTAHIAYFREEFVKRRKWLTESTFADLVALCQFLPGPASTQMNFAVGYMRGGLRGGLLAWAAFTLPSAFLMIGAGYGVIAFGDTGGEGWIRGLMIAVVAVVAKAVLEMATRLCPDRLRIGIAVGATLLLGFFTHPLGQVAVISLGAIAGYFLIKPDYEPAASQRSLFRRGTSRRPLFWLGCFLFLLAFLPLLAWVLPRHTGIGYFDAFYRSGALVFGGGHVVLPLLEQAVVEPGWVAPDTFLAGYGLAQAVPGPLFTFSAYLGTVAALPPNGIAGGVLCLLAIFLPSLLLVIGVLPYWNRLRRHTGAQAALAGASAAVVGLLLAALYDPVFTTGIRSPRDFGLAVFAFAALLYGKIPPWALVPLAALIGAVV